MVYISLHSYGQLLLSPWGYTNERTENYQDQVQYLVLWVTVAKSFFQQNAAKEAALAIKNTTGVSYSYGTISEMMCEFLKCSQGTVSLKILQTPPPAPASTSCNTAVSLISMVWNYAPLIIRTVSLSTCRHRIFERQATK